MPRIGALLLLSSAAAFGAMGVFGKLAYDEGVTVGTLLAVRFALAAAVLWAIVLATGRAATLRALPRREIATALALGAVGYAAQAGAYFAALERLDAGLLGLVLYTFPVVVTVAAIVLGREAFSGRTAGALVLACAGIALVLAGAAGGALDPLGTALGVAAALIYSAYILSSEGVARRLDHLVLATLVCTGAAVSLALGALLAGDLHPGPVTTAGYGWITALALISTVGAIGLFFAGLSRVGATAASILSTLEPVVTVALAAAVFGEALGPAQLLGGALVLAAAIALRLDPPPATPPAPAPASSNATAPAPSPLPVTVAP